MAASRAVSTACAKWPRNTPLCSTRSGWRLAPSRRWCERSEPEASHCFDRAREPLPIRPSMLADRDGDHELRPSSRRAGAGDRAAQRLGDQIIDDAEAQPAAAMSALGGEEGL